MTRSRAFGVAATLVVLLALVAGFVSLGGRSRQRAIRADEQRVNDLRALSRTVNFWYSAHKTLPPSINQSLPPDAGFHLTDPGTNAAYEYLPGADSIYQVCAAFETESLSPTRPLSPFSDHHMGRQCFTVDATMPVFER